MKDDFTRVAIINRGEPAVRFIRAVRDYNRAHRASIETVAFCAHGDRRARFAREADEAVDLPAFAGPDTAGLARRSPYLDYGVLERALVATKADAAWVGWGFVSEQPAFAELCARLGLTFIGPPAAAMRLLGDKIGAKRLATQLGIAVTPWGGAPADTLEAARAHAGRIGYPVVIKPASGAGGRGIRVVETPDRLGEAYLAARDEALKLFADDTVFVERWLAGARHIEVQVAADRVGTTWAVDLRECSVQRLHQKLLEESPALGLSAEGERTLRSAAVRLCQAAGYQNLATVEFLLDSSGRHASLMEVNPRLQVEHAVTELTTGLDLVQMQIHLARGGRLEGTAPEARGHAIEVRLNAEDAGNAFAPSPGRLAVFRVPTRAGLRVDSGAAEGDEIRPEYDSMFAKMIACGPRRADALDVLARGLDDSTAIIEGGVTNRAFLMHLLDRDEVQKGHVSVDWLDGLVARGQHVAYDFADVALLVAAAEVYDADFTAEREEFFASAQRLRPITSREIGRQVEFRYRGRRYPMRVYRIGSEHYRVDVGAARVDVRVDPISAHQRLVAYEGNRHRVVVTSHGLTHLVEVDGAVHQISRDEAGLVRAFAPAVVVEMSVHPGDRVNKGDRVALLEAMKMETPITAPCAGVVRDVLVLQNAQVGTGAALVHIDPDVAGEQEPGEAVKFKGASAPPAPGGAQPSRPRAVVAGIKAFTQALQPTDPGFGDAVLSDLRDLMLGSDIDGAEAKRLIDDYRRACERMPADHELLLDREEKVLRIFSDVSALFRSQPAGDEANDASALSAGQYFLTYLRTLESRGAGLPPAFVAALERALAHYGSDSLDVTPVLKSRLLWMWKAHQRVDQQVGVVVAILERRLRHASELGSRTGQSFLTVLDRLIASSEGQHPALTDLARDVRYRYFEQPTFDRDRRLIYAEMEGHLTYLMRTPDAPDRDERIRALVDCPVPLSGLLSGRLDVAAPALRQLVLEVLTRRYYRIRPLEGVKAIEVDGHSILSADYAFEGRQVRFVATHAAWEDLAAALHLLKKTADAVPPELDVAVDMYVLRLASTEALAETSAALVAALNEIGLRRPVRRVVVAVAGARGEWATSSTAYFTFRQGADGFTEDRQYRGVHPMIGKRLQMWRFSHFDTTRLPSAEDVFLFRGVAHDNPKDERLFALGEVRDTSAIRDADGTLLQVPHLERTMLECLSAIREVQFRKSPDERLQWNRVVLDVWPTLSLSRDELLSVMRRLGHETEGLGLEKVVVRAQMPDDSGTVRETMLSMSNPGGHGIVLRFEEPHDRALQPLDEYTQKVVRMRQRGLTYPYEVVRLLTPGRDHTESDMPPGEFVEYDLAGEQLVPVDRPWGRNTANVVVGLIRNFTTKYPDSVTRVAIFGDPSREMGSVAEPECRRILAALDLAERMRLPLEWFTLSAGAKISMESGTENMDWIGRVLRRIIEFTQAGHEVNIVVTGINVGAQPYWNAEATMLMHTRGILVMMPESAMVLTGKTALDYSGSVSAEDNLGIGGYERIMGPNGQAQYWARDINEACQILLRHYDHAYVAPGELFPRRAQTTDPFTRDVCLSPHGRFDGTEFHLVGDVFSDAANPGRKKPFDIRRVMAAVCDQDHQPLERWPGMRDAEVGVVWDAHVGGYPVCLLGFESRSLSRLGFVPTDGPDHWTSGTLFPMSSKKIARSINTASDNRPLVVLANLSGFDGSPESMRRRQLEFGAEIGRAVTNFRGPIVFVVISRYHGGAFVVFSKTLNDNMQVAALEGTYASVIGGAPAAAVVFAREVDGRTRKDPRVKALEQELAAADEEGRRRLRPRLSALYKSVRSEKLGEVADEFDRIHSVHRALEVGSLDRILPPSELRPFVIQAIEAGMAKEAERRANQDGEGDGGAAGQVETRPS